MSEVTGVANAYSRILAVEVWNFMSIEHGRVEFDEKNIINLKGYNDSGKSAILTALKVCLLNSNPSKQVSFIQDDKEYFRIVVYFDDGVQLMRDKYINGQSLIEMRKDGQCIFSTKEGKALTRVSEIPKPVADYLGLVTFDGGALNARSCFEKQLGVQTTGAENYKMFNTVLKSEEIATAGSLLNNDKNKLAADIDAVDREIQAQKSILGVGDKITDGMLVWLKDHDATLDGIECAEDVLARSKSLVEAMNAMPRYPELPIVDMSQFSAVGTIHGIMSELSSLRIQPEVPSVSDGRLSSLIAIQRIADELDPVDIQPEVPVLEFVQLFALMSIEQTCKALRSIPVYSELTNVDDRQVQVLLAISGVVDSIGSISDDIARNDVNLAETAEELERLQAEASNHGSKFVKCPNCGELFDPELMHSHVGA